MIITNAIKYGLVLLAIVVGLGVKAYFGDNPEEEMVEDAIEYVVKEEADIDLTPILSPDKSNTK
jgi:hypothetical protein